MNAMFDLFIIVDCFGFLITQGIGSMYQCN